jgi:hypothetical protein
MVRMGKKLLLKGVKSVDGMTVGRFREEIEALKTPPGGFETSISRKSGLDYFLYGANGAKNFQRQIRVYIRDEYQNAYIKHYDVRNYD